MASNTDTMKIHEQTQVEWKIANIFAVADLQAGNLRCFVSPTFTFAGSTWRMILASKILSDPEYTNIVLMRDDSHNCSVEYKFGLKRIDGLVELLDRGILKNDQMESDRHFIHLSEVQQQPGLAPSDAVIITCTLKLEGPDIQPQPLTVRGYESLSRNFRDLFTTKEDWDVTLRVEETDFLVHKAVLIARSEVFSAMFQHDTLENQSSIIRIPDCDLESFPLFLEYFYTGRLDELSYKNALNLYDASEKYGVLDLRNFCREHLMENLSVETWFEIISMADLYDDDELFSTAKNFFVKNYRNIFNSPEWNEFYMNNAQLGWKILKVIPQF